MTRGKSTTDLAEINAELNALKWDPPLSKVLVRKKPGVTAKYRARRRRAAMKEAKPIREYVFEREGGICRCCRIRRAESRHELKSRGAGGKITKRNCVAVCGDGVRGCHGFLQRYEIKWAGGPEGAEGLLRFIPTTQQSADWMRVAINFNVCSMPGTRNDELEAP